MKAEEIIPATHRLEQSGMTRNEAEAAVSELQKVVAPLATKDDAAKLGDQALLEAFGGNAWSGSFGCLDLRIFLTIFPVF